MKLNLFSFFFFSQTVRCFHSIKDNEFEYPYDLSSFEEILQMCAANAGGENVSGDSSKRSTLTRRQNEARDMMSNFGDLNDLERKLWI